MCLEPFTPSKKYGAEFPERSEIRSTVDFRKSMDLWSSEFSTKYSFRGS